MKDKITIVIPTYRRHHILQKTLPFLLEFNVPILVMDATETPHAPSVENPAIEYVHMPESGIVQRMKATIPTRVKTPFMLMNADDIYPSKTGLQLGLSFLEKHPDYSSIQGSVLHESSGQVDIYKPEAYLHQASSNCPGTRLLQHFAYYHPKFYSLQKTESWNTCLNLYPDGLVNYNMMEIYFAMMMLVHGKSANKRYFHHVTSLIPSADKCNLKLYGNSHDMIYNVRYYDEIELIKETVCNYLEKERGMVEPLARRHVSNAISLWLVNSLPKKTYYWLNNRRPKTFMDRIRNEWDTLKGRTVQKKHKIERKEQKTARLANKIDLIANDNGPGGREELDIILKLLMQAKE